MNVNMNFRSCGTVTVTLHTSFSRSHIWVALWMGWVGVQPTKYQMLSSWLGGFWSSTIRQIDGVKYALIKYHTVWSKTALSLKGRRAAVITVTVTASARCQHLVQYQTVTRNQRAATETALGTDDSWASWWDSCSGAGQWSSMLQRCAT
jgi:hypothetical protein